MQQFDYQAELKKIIDGKQLVEVYLHDAPTYKVAYILSANNEYLTFAEVSSSATFSGVIICHLSDVDSVRAETPYLGELAKQIKEWAEILMMDYEKKQMSKARYIDLYDWSCALIKELKN